MGMTPQAGYHLELHVAGVVVTVTSDQEAPQAVLAELAGQVLLRTPTGTMAEQASLLLTEIRRVTAVRATRVTLQYAPRRWATAELVMELGARTLVNTIDTDATAAADDAGAGACPRCGRPLGPLHTC